MEDNESKYLLIFKSYNQAMLLYNELLKRDCDVELVSTPCRLSKGCSQSIVFKTKDAKKVIEEAQKSKIMFKDIYKIFIRNGIKSYIHI